MAFEYLPVLVLMFFALAFAVVIIVLTDLVRPSNPNREKNSTYECGSPLFTDARGMVSIKYFIISMLFLLFDVEAAFLYPWAINYDKLGLFGFIEIVIFIFILLIGYFYAWRKGALEWES
jgi:NADH-quinone oxidoreductase subunit A